MKNYSNKDKGFTLIELLVVVAIIGLLSSIVMASLNSARGKAKDAAIKEEVSQFTNLLALEYNDNGSYCNLQNAGWVNYNKTCSASFSGTYAAQAQAICNNIYNNASDAPGVALGYSAGQLRVYINVGSTGCGNTYSIMAALNDGNWYCSGGSGRKGEYSDYSTPAGGCWNSP